MKNDAHLLPARLAAAAAAIANARAGRRGALAVTDILEVLPRKLFAEVVEDARAALDATEFVTPIRGERSNNHTQLRIIKAAEICADLNVQAVVLLDIDQDGTVTLSTFAEKPGTPSEAIAEWAVGLESYALSIVPFRTVFGWGAEGVPTPLSAEEREGLSASALAYADRNSVGGDE